MLTFGRNALPVQISTATELERRVPIPDETRSRTRTRPSTRRSVVRILFAKPNILTSRSAYFWLTAEWRGLVRNGQYCGKRTLSESALYRPGFAQRGAAPGFRATFSRSPQRHAHLVTGAISAARTRRWAPGSAGRRKAEGRRQPQVLAVISPDQFQSSSSRHRRTRLP